MPAKLPLDRSTFSVLRTLNYLYVDKTAYAYQLITRGHYYFLSRPRRFGKSLFVSTLYEILTGNRTLFNGLLISSTDYAWPEHGVIMLNFSGMKIEDKDSFDTSICLALQKTADNYELAIDLSSLSSTWALDKVVTQLHKRFGKVAVLIDEYDNPIVHAQDFSRAKEIRDAMLKFFTAIKSLDAQIDFVFITGVSSFTKAGLFSGMNNLQIITLDPRYASICGYTQEEVDHYFVEHIDQWTSERDTPREKLRAEIKHWYNGYSFGVDVPKVYNPFSLMHALAKMILKNFWFQSGTPTFLVKELEKEYRRDEYRFFDPTTFRANEDSLGSFDVGATPLPALMFQSGYLTITGYDQSSGLYQLGYPNFEVQESTEKNLIALFVHVDIRTIETVCSDLEQALLNIDIEKAVEYMRNLFAHIPYQLHMKEEKFYHALLHMIFNVYGMNIVSEQPISHGRIDLITSLKNLLYVIEIKFNDTPENALKQIEDMGYYKPFIATGKRIILLGLSFNRSKKKFDIVYKHRILE